MDEWVCLFAAVTVLFSSCCCDCSCGCCFNLSRDTKLYCAVGVYATRDLLSCKIWLVVHVIFSFLFSMIDDVLSFLLSTDWKSPRKLIIGARGGNGNLVHRDG